MHLVLPVLWRSPVGELSYLVLHRLHCGICGQTWPRAGVAHNLSQIHTDIQHSTCPACFFSHTEEARPFQKSWALGQAHLDSDFSNWIQAYLNSRSWRKLPPLWSSFPQLKWTVVKCGPIPAPHTVSGTCYRGGEMVVNSFRSLRHPAKGNEEAIENLTH